MFLGLCHLRDDQSLLTTLDSDEEHCLGKDLGQKKQNQLKSDICLENPEVYPENVLK